MAVMADSGAAPARAGDFTYDVALPLLVSSELTSRRLPQHFAGGASDRSMTTMRRRPSGARTSTRTSTGSTRRPPGTACCSASEAYAKKVWTSHERRSAQARALQSSGEYVLPVRFDDTEIPGLRSTVAYVEAPSATPVQLAGL
jgi:hypothetical protein